MNVKSWMKGFFLILVSVFLLTGNGTAAVAPNATPLQEITSQSATGSLSAGPDGSVYAIQALPSGGGTVIRKFDRFFGNQHEFAAVNARHIAVSKDNEVFVADPAGRKIIRYDQNGREIGAALSLGAGSMPKHVSFDRATGNVIITISGLSGRNQNVLVYDRALTAPVLAISGLDADLGVSGSNSIRALATVFVNDNYYVLASYTLGSSMSYVYLLKYDRTGAFVAKSAASFYGNRPDQLLMAKDMIADSAGRLYVTDAANMKVLVLDTDTLMPLSSFDYSGSPISIATGITMLPGGRMMVSGMPSGNGKVFIFGIDNYSVLNAAPKSVVFSTAVQTTQQVTVSNTGNSGLSYTASSADSWIRIAPNPASGTLSAGGSASFSVGFDAAGLALGTYSGEVSIVDNNGEVEKIAVTLKNQQLSAAPSTLEFAYEVGGPAPAPRTITVVLSGDTAGSTVWNASASPSWITIDPVAPAVSGNGTTTITVAVNPSGLKAGAIYQGSITVAADLTSGAPAIVPVSLAVTSSAAVQPSTAVAQAPATAAPKNIVVASGKSASGPSTIRIFNSSFEMVREFAPFGTNYSGAISVTTGDVDGDGYDEIIAAYGSDAGNQARVSIFDRTGALLPNADFIAFPAGFRSGARVAAGDVDGDGKAEVIVSTGPGKKNDAQVRVFAYRNGLIADTGVNFQPFATMYGCNIAAGDVDGDSRDEIIAAPGPDPSASAEVRVFKVDASLDIGNWSSAEVNAFVASLEPGAGANVAAGDMNADGKAEIVASTGDNDLSIANKIIVYAGNGTASGVSIVSDTTGGIEVSVGDINADGSAEIVASPVVSGNSTSLLIIYKNGVSMGTYEAFQNTLTGAQVSLGTLGY